MKKFEQSAGKKFEFRESCEYKDTGRTIDRKTGKPRPRRINVPVGGKDYITCQVCKRKFIYLEPHLLEEHKITKQEYHKKFGPQWKTICDAYKLKLSLSSETNTPNTSK